MEKRVDFGGVRILVSRFFCQPREWVFTTNILAERLTKALLPQRHKDFLRLLGLEMEKVDEDSKTFIKGCVGLTAEIM